MLLDGKVCIVVGSGSPRGIGHATSRLFAEHGALVIAADRGVNGVADAGLHPVRDLAGCVTAATCDVTSVAQCDLLVALTVERFGRVDCLVNCAGVVDGRPFMEIEEADFQQMADVNLKGAFNLCKAVLPAMLELRAGSIVNMSSSAAQRGGGLVGAAHYAATKGGVLSLTKSIAREFGPMGIRANAVCPAMIDTAMLDGLDLGYRRSIVEQIPLGRLGLPHEPAGACLFLASDLSSFVTGATLDVNGGSHIH